MCVEQMKCGVMDTFAQGSSVQTHRPLISMNILIKAMFKIEFLSSYCSELPKVARLIRETSTNKIRHRFEK